MCVHVCLRVLLVGGYVWMSEWVWGLLSLGPCGTWSWSSNGCRVVLGCLGPCFLLVPGWQASGGVGHHPLAVDAPSWTHPSSSCWDSHTVVAEMCALKSLVFPGAADGQHLLSLAVTFCDKDTCISYFCVLGAVCFFFVVFFFLTSAAVSNTSCFGICALSLCYIFSHFLFCCCFFPHCQLRRYHTTHIL